MKLTDDQQEALDLFSDFLTNDEQFLIIQGSAGTGKSTIIKQMVKRYNQRKEMLAVLRKMKSDDIESILLTATTNPAVAVLSEMLEDSGVVTIHNLLDLRLFNDQQTGKKRLALKKNAGIIYDSVIIIDEASMITDELFEYIKNRTENCKIILVGDQYQLAPVGQTETVMETLECKKADLSQVMRNDGDILKTSAQFKETVKTGVFTPIEAVAPQIMHVDGPTFQKLIDKAYLASDYTSKSARILAWTNARVLEYSQYIREAKGLPTNLQVGEVVVSNKPIIELQVPTDSLVTITGMGGKYVNDYGIEGRDIEIDNRKSLFYPENPMAERNILRELRREKDWKGYFDVKDTWLDLRTHYSCTVHKSQGNSFKRVFVDLADIGRCAIPSDVARMLYVAISRATDTVILYGQLPPKYAGTDALSLLQAVSI